MEAGGDIFSALIQAAAELVIWLLELPFYAVANILYGVLWLCSCTKSAGSQRRRKLPEETRYLIRGCMHSLLALGLVGLVLYFGWPRKPAPTKIQKAQEVVEKARRI